MSSGEKTISGLTVSSALTGTEPFVHGAGNTATLDLMASYMANLFSNRLTVSVGSDPSNMFVTDGAADNVQIKEAIDYVNDQGSPTVTHDIFIDNQYSSDALPTMSIRHNDNIFDVENGIINYYTGSGFTTTKPSNITFVPQTYWSTGADTGQVVTATSDGVAIFQDIPPILRTNLFTNPSFEVDLSSYSALTNPVIGSAVTRDSTHAYDGTWSMKFANTGASTDDTYVTYHWISLELDSYYTVSAYYYVDSQTDGSFLDKAIEAYGNSSGPPVNVVQTNLGTPTTGLWIRYSLTFFTGTETSGFIRFYVPQGVTYIDALVLETGSTAGVYIGYPGDYLSTLNIQNPSFTTLVSGNYTLNDAANIILGTSTGSKIGTSISQKLAFYNSTPIVQRASANQVAVVATASTQTTPYGFTTQAQADALVTLVNELRTAMVNLGLIKGSA